MNYAIIKDGAVINQVIWDEGNGWSPPEGTLSVEIPGRTFVDTRYVYLDEVFSVPPAS